MSVLVSIILCISNSFFLIIAIYISYHYHHSQQYPPILSININMKLSSFAATIATSLSLLSTTEGLQNNLRSVVPSISTELHRRLVLPTIRSMPVPFEVIPDLLPPLPQHPRKISRGMSKQLTTDTTIPLGIREMRHVWMMVMLPTIWRLTVDTMKVLSKTAVNDTTAMRWTLVWVVIQWISRASILLGQMPTRSSVWVPPTHYLLPTCLIIPPHILILILRLVVLVTMPGKRISASRGVVHLYHHLQQQQ